MLLVKTKIGPSRIHGMGLFADQQISKGTVVQRFVPGFDLIIRESSLSGLSDAAKAQFLHYAYKIKKSGDYVLCFDDARFLNHSDQPNLISDDPNEEVDVASRDIQKGEELTVDYRDFDADFEYKLKHDQAD